MYVVKEIIQNYKDRLYRIIETDLVPEILVNYWQIWFQKFNRISEIYLVIKISHDYKDKYLVPDIYRKKYMVTEIW